MGEMGLITNTPDISNAIEINNTTLNSDNLKNFDTRKIIVEQVISDIMANEKFTVNVNLENVNINQKQIERFIIELIPRLKEIGVSVIITNNNILSSEFLSKKGIQKKQEE